MVFLHFSNLAPSAEKATLLSVLDGSIKFHKKETMQAHIDAHGSSEGWRYQFSLVVITDKTADELQYLKEEIYLEPSDTAINKYTFLEPIYDTKDYWTMRNTGQISLTFNEFEKYMRLT